MTGRTRRKTSLSLDANTLDAARDLGINVLAIVETALGQAVAEARRKAWRDEDAVAFAAQAEWHEQNRHPLADIMLSPGRASWMRQGASIPPNTPTSFKAIFCSRKTRK